MTGRSAVILAAGVGSRMDEWGRLFPKPLINIEGVDKCSLEVNIDNLLEVGVENIAIIVGYKKELISEFVRHRYPDKNIICIYNPYFAQFGCEYSVSSSLMMTAIFKDITELVIVEADTVMDVSYLHMLFNTHTDEDYKVLARDNSYIEDTKSVVLSSSQVGVVNKFCYDKKHISVSKTIPDGYMIIGESMQTWYLSGESLDTFFNLCSDYLIAAEDGTQDCKANGVYNLNRLAEIHPSTPVYVEGSRWYNFNKMEDFYEEDKYSWIK